MFESYLAPAASVAAIAALLVLAARAAVPRHRPQALEGRRLLRPSQVPRARHADGAIVKRGDTGRRVKKVQRALGLEPDGIYGMQTARAVDAFQALAKLHRSGRVDRSTWRALFRAPVGSAGTGAGPTRPAAPRPASRQPEAPAVPACPRRRAPARCAATLTAPLRGTRTSAFGDGRNHAGVDIAAPVGRAVRAVACGTRQLHRAPSSGYGRMICIRHTPAFSRATRTSPRWRSPKGTPVGAGPAHRPRRHDRPHVRRAPALRDARRRQGRAIPRRTSPARARSPAPLVAGAPRCAAGRHTAGASCVTMDGCMPPRTRGPALDRGARAAERRPRGRRRGARLRPVLLAPRRGGLPSRRRWTAR